VTDEQLLAAALLRKGPHLRSRVVKTTVIREVTVLICVICGHTIHFAQWFRRAGDLYAHDDCAKKLKEGSDGQ
jgi:hypothetical protein